MQFILFEDSARLQLLPLTFTRPVCELRIGIDTIREKWERHLKTKVHLLALPYLADKFSDYEAKDSLMINGKILPDKKLITAIKKLKPNQILIRSKDILAARVNKNFFKNKIEEMIKTGHFQNFKSVEYKESRVLGTAVRHLWDIFLMNDAILRNDFKEIVKGKHSQKIGKENILYNKKGIFIDKGAKVFASVLNAETGPIYIGKNAEIMEGCTIRGPVSIGENTIIKMGAKIYGATAIGPECRVGGEINNSVILGYSNKAHDGFLGNSVIGEWCNIGADSNNSNLKNNYANIKVWNYAFDQFVDSGQTFCGLIMGDHSKCGINTMFNTGTVVGVCCNIFGSGFPRTFIPDFSWGGVSGFSTHQIKAAFETAKRVMERRHKKLERVDEKILFEVFQETQKYRIWDKPEESKQ